MFIFPEDIDLTGGPAANHRLFLDLYLSQADHCYLESLSSYQKTLVQRNKLLRDIGDGNAEESQLGAWDELLAVDAVNISTKRNEFIKAISGPASSYYDRFDSDNKLTIAYTAKTTLVDSEMKSAILTQMQEYREREIRAGLSLVGPHRDRLEMNLDDRPVRHFGSRGQKRCAMIAIKLAVADYFRQILGVEVVLILDEAFAELDSQKSRALMEALGSAAQVFIATAGEFDPGARTFRRFQVDKGKIIDRPGADRG